MSRIATEMPGNHWWMPSGRFWFEIHPVRVLYRARSMTVRRILLILVE
jgi:hypothetical protein